jgi:ATP-dependent Clp protease adapter protein ClpS
MKQEMRIAQSRLQKLDQKSIHLMLKVHGQGKAVHAPKTPVQPGRHKSYD